MRKFLVLIWLCRWLFRKFHILIMTWRCGDRWGAISLKYRENNIIPAKWLPPLNWKVRDADLSFVCENFMLVPSYREHSSVHYEFENNYQFNIDAKNVQVNVCIRHKFWVCSLAKEFSRTEVFQKIIDKPSTHSNRSPSISSFMLSRVKKM